MTQKTSNELREAFLTFFAQRGHARVKSSGLIPSNDPTLFFTNAGMVQFKDVFLGEDKRPYTTATTSQKCMRVSGKHNDLENVGHTPRHHTFFEMLGNFSFGDYFKREAIEYAWEFLTNELKLDPKHLVVTVFRDDDEAEQLWTKHIASEKIFRRDERDNFWTMGDTGPCGPCSEILWDFHPEKPVKDVSDLDTDRFMEIWNLVFMQFERSADGSMKPLAKPSIDTGMGLERLAAVVQGYDNNWDSDAFTPLIASAAEACDCKHPNDEQSRVALRVIADHARTMAFLIAEGVTPSNEGRGYVLRRIMRRAIRYGRRLGVTKPFLTQMLPAVIAQMGHAYPELAQHREFIERVILSEEQRFLETLDRGLLLLSEQFAALRAAGKKQLPGDVVFQLYDTFGFPADLTNVIAQEEGFILDEASFEKLMDEQRARARASWKGSGEEKVAAVWQELQRDGVRTAFVGYDQLSVSAKVLAIIHDGRRVDHAPLGEEIQFVTDVTPFYGESGGQVGDTGRGHHAGNDMEILDTRRPAKDIVVHLARVTRGTLSVGDTVQLDVEETRRADIRRNHTATHLLHKALRAQLGLHVKQAGSLVAPDRLRFDFSHFEALTKEQVKRIEDEVNAEIRANHRVTVHELAYDEAVQQGAMALFGEKYGDVVRMVDVEGASKELCGGTHVNTTGEIGRFVIRRESSAAAGVRRIEAVTGRAAEAYIADLRERERQAADEAQQKEQSKAQEREEQQRRSSEIKARVDALLQQVFDVSGVKVLAAEIPNSDGNTLREIAERCRAKLGSSVVVLGAAANDKAMLVAMVSADVTEKIKAGEIIRAITPFVGGKGGGRPDMAQGGGPKVDGLTEALEHVKACIHHTTGA